MEVARKYQFLAAMSQKLPVRLMYVRFVSMICRFQVEDVIFKILSESAGKFHCSQFHCLSSIFVRRND
jgi:hypothetical protein